MLARLQIIGCDIAADPGAICECHCAPALADFCNAALAIEAGAIGQAEDHVEAKTGARAKFEQLVRAGAGDDGWF